MTNPIREKSFPELFSTTLKQRKEQLKYALISDPQNHELRKELKKVEKLIEEQFYSCLKKS